MLNYWCKTGSKLGHFLKIAYLFNQNGRGQGVVKIRDKQFFTLTITQFRLRSLKLVVQIVLILFDLVNLSFPNFVIFIILRLKNAYLKSSISR